MSERRLVQSIHTREVIPTSLASDESCYLIAVTGDQIEILSNLLNYAHRKINWCDEVVDANHYFLPDGPTWDDISALVDDLEYRLMNTCSLQELITAIEGLCDCLPGGFQQYPGALSNGQIQTYQGAGNLVAEEVPATYEPVDEDACAAAQTFWNMCYEYWQEIGNPIMGTYDYLVVTMFAFFAAIAAPAILWLAQLGFTLNTINEIWQVFNENTQAALSDWLFSFKSEIICAVYHALTSDPPNFDEFDALVAESDLSSWTKFALDGMRKTFVPIAQLCKGTAWAVARLEVGACNDCVPGGCFDMCNEDWVITPEYCVVDPVTCWGTILSENTNYVAAQRDISQSYAHVSVYLDPPALEMPFFALRVRLEDASLNAENWDIEVTVGTGLSLYEHDFALADPVSLELRTIAGTATVVHYVCVEEATP